MAAVSRPHCQKSWFLSCKILQDKRHQAKKCLSYSIFLQYILHISTYTDYRRIFCRIYRFLYVLKKCQEITSISWHFESSSIIVGCELAKYWIKLCLLRILNRQKYINAKELMKKQYGGVVINFVFYLIFATSGVIQSKNCLRTIIFRGLSIQQFFAVYSEEGGSAEFLF